MSTKKTLTVSLEEPVEFEGETHSELTFRACRAKDMAATDLVKGEVRKSFALYASMADVPIQVIEELGMSDFEKVATETVPLMGKSAQKAAKAPGDQMNESAIH